MYVFVGDADSHAAKAAAVEIREAACEIRRRAECRLVRAAKQQAAEREVGNDRVRVLRNRRSGVRAGIAVTRTGGGDSVELKNIVVEDARTAWSSRERSRRDSNAVVSSREAPCSRRGAAVRHLANKLTRAAVSPEHEARDIRSAEHARGHGLIRGQREAVPIDITSSGIGPETATNRCAERDWSGGADRGHTA